MVLAFAANAASYMACDSMDLVLAIPSDERADVKLAAAAFAAARATAAALVALSYAVFVAVVSMLRAVAVANDDAASLSAAAALSAAAWACSDTAFNSDFAAVNCAAARSFEFADAAVD